MFGGDGIAAQGADLRWETEADVLGVLDIRPTIRIFKKGGHCKGHVDALELAQLLNLATESIAPLKQLRCLAWGGRLSILLEAFSEAGSQRRFSFVNPVRVTYWRSSSSKPILMNLMRQWPGYHEQVYSLCVGRYPTYGKFVQALCRAITKYVEDEERFRVSGPYVFATCLAND